MQTTLDPNQNFSLGIKLSFKKRRNANIDHVHLEHTEEGHNKFYIIHLHNHGNSDLTNFSVWITYGKIGTTGSISKHGFDTKEAAYKFINKKKGEKIRKGYKIKDSFHH